MSEIKFYLLTYLLTYFFYSTYLDQQFLMNWWAKVLTLIWSNSLKNIYNIQFENQGF